MAVSSFLERRRQNGCILILSNTPVLDLHDPVRHMGKFEIVGDHDDGLMKLAAGLTQQAGDGDAGLAVQIARRFIRQQYGRPGGESSGDGSPLPFAAGQTGGQVIQLSLQAQKAYQMGDIRPVGAAVIQ